MRSPIIRWIIFAIATYLLMFQSYWVLGWATRYVPNSLFLMVPFAIIAGFPVRFLARAVMSIAPRRDYSSGVMFWILSIGEVIAFWQSWGHWSGEYRFLRVVFDFSLFMGFTDVKGRDDATENGKVES